MSRHPHFHLPNLDTNTFVNETCQGSYVAPCGFGYEQLSSSKTQNLLTQNSHIIPVTNLAGAIFLPLGLFGENITKGLDSSQRLGSQIHLLAYHFRGFYRAASVDGDIISVSLFWDTQNYTNVGTSVADIISPEVYFSPFLVYYSTSCLQRADTLNRFELLYRYSKSIAGVSVTDLLADPQPVDFTVPLLGRTIEYFQDRNTSTCKNLVLLFQTETGIANWTFGSRLFFSDTPYEDPP